MTLIVTESFANEKGWPAATSRMLCEFGGEFEVAEAGSELLEVGFELGDAWIDFATGNGVVEFAFDVDHGLGEGRDGFAVLDGFVADPCHDGQRDCAEQGMEIGLFHSNR
jgi:hypothetical protein